MTVREWMSASPAVISPSTSVLEAWELMQRWRVRHFPVVEGERLVGIVTDRDIRLNLPPSASNPTVQEIRALLAKVTAAEIMTRDVITIEPDQPIEHAAGVMLACKIRSLPVVEHERLVGILTETDVLRAVVGSRSARADRPADAQAPAPARG